MRTTVALAVAAFVLAGCARTETPPLVVPPEAVAEPTSAAAPAPVPTVVKWVTVTTTTRPTVTEQATELVTVTTTKRPTVTTTRVITVPPSPSPTE